MKKIYHRIYDPVNYKETCYWIAYENLSLIQKQFLENGNTQNAISWLGSEVGQKFLKEVKKLEQSYPYKETCSCAVVMGKVQDQSIVDGHIKWFNENIKNYE